MMEEKVTRKASVRLPQEKRVADIMAAARRVIAQRGYENALMSEIAEQAGMVEGSLYRYFENKRDLLTKVVDDWYCEAIHPGGDCFAFTPWLASQAAGWSDIAQAHNANGAYAGYVWR